LFTFEEVFEMNDKKQQIEKTKQRTSKLQTNEVKTQDSRHTTGASPDVRSDINKVLSFGSDKTKYSFCGPLNVATFNRSSVSSLTVLNFDL
jgi:hypothetical protein